MVVNPFYCMAFEVSIDSCVNFVWEKVRRLRETIPRVLLDKWYNFFLVLRNLEAKSPWILSFSSWLWTQLVSP
jgi:hypothetical protein